MSRLLVTHLLAKGSQQIAIVNRSQRRPRSWPIEFPNVPSGLYGLEEMMATSSGIGYRLYQYPEPRNQF
jgi:glutamyl-tRNA reductase